MRRLRPGGAVLSGPPQLGSWTRAASTETISVYVCPDCGAERTEAESAAPTTAANALVTSADSKSYTYTFENVTEDHAISVTFEKPSPVIVQEVTINGNTQTAVIDEAAVQKAVEAVTASAADTITIIPTADSSSISSVSVELPAGRGPDHLGGQCRCGDPDVQWNRHPPRKCPGLHCPKRD